MIKFDVRADFKQVERYLKRLAGPKGTQVAMVRALNKTAGNVRAEAVRQIREKRLVPVKTIRSGLQIQRARLSHLEARVIAKGGPISIRYFSRFGKRGVTARVSKGSKRVLLKRYGNKAFTNPRLGGGLSVFVRTGKRRLPIEKWPGVPGIASVFVQRKVERAMREVAASSFQKRIREELRFVIEQAGR